MIKSSKNNILSCAIAGACLLLLTLSGCSPAKFMPEGENLYRGSNVVLDGPAVPINKELLVENIESDLYPKPNKKFIGLFYTKLWLYKKVEPKEHKKKSFKHWLKYKLGEEPVLVSEVDTFMMTRLIQKQMLDNGFFYTEVSPEIKTKKNLSTIEYTVEHQEPKRIEKFNLPSEETPVNKLINSWDKFELKEGDIYNVAKLKKDRLDLAEHIRSKGYFEFTEKNIIYLVDTARASGNLGLDLRIKAPEGDSIHRKFYIDDVTVYTTYEPETLADTTNYRRTINYKGLKIYQNYEYMGRKAVHRINLIEPGRPFSVRDYNSTINRLINTNVFRYVNIYYRKQGSDSLDVDIYLTPTKYQGIKFDVEASTSNRSFLGSSVSVSYNNSNLFRGAESFTLKASAGTEFQIINDKAMLNILNVNLEAKLEIPGLISFFKTRKLRSEVMPKTYLSLDENFQKWLQYYSLNSLKFGAGYEWTTRQILNHHLEPLSFEWITLLSKTPEFDNLLDENPLLKRSFRTSMIFGQSYGIAISSRRSEGQRSFVYYLGSVDLAGNLGYLIGSLAKPNVDPPYRVFGVQFANYAKTDQEIRHTWDINKKTSLVSRFNFGVGIAYGNSEVMPYVKQFYVGGPNTIRAFEFRSLGPGRYSPGEDAETNPIEQSGDIKLLMNLEYRFTLYRFLKAAIFTDAGNVWLRKDDPDRPGGEFKINSFYKELALGTGIGLRLDFDFFALRIDLGLPLYIPYNDEGDRWFHQFPESTFKEWRKANWAWNIAIGYPF